MKKILITGASGFIGTSLVESLCLSEKKFEVHCLLRNTSKFDLNFPNLKILRFLNYSEISNFFESNQYNCIIHLATTYIHSESPLDIEKIVNSNITLGSVILRCMRNQEKKNFINISTNAEFDSHGEEAPNSFYASTKLAFRKTTQYYKYSEDYNTTSLIFYDNYGLNDNRSKVFDLLLLAAKNNKSLDLSPGEQRLSPIHVKDTIEAIIACLKLIQENELQDFYSVCGPQLLSLKEISENIEEIIKKKISTKWGAIPYRENQIMSPFITQQLPNWTPKIEFKDGIKELITEKYNIQISQK